MRQHWFISSYIAAYIQVLYRVDRVRSTGLTVTRGIGSSPQGSPRSLASAGRRRGQRSNLFGGAHCRDGYCVYGGCEGTAGPGHAKTSSPGRKTVPGPSHVGTREEGEETNGSENETCLVAARPPGSEPGGLLLRRGLPGSAVRCRAGLKAADGNDLVS